ncbi:1-aminocyclopropane-1-carboxylate synthase-like protein 1 [Physella acuta]|uniref:1-aminocyclopropane-1-carboxylate synthase-like protein 1 n=1 Tax=Physella acuta TaxID=109671 RepID=UPI0027DB4E5D|nr:1-aminocyclopropane-1-carboxylate synthase-like protein 1 [Physella acuta]XP_059142104.1 1-aminocyclopropane-1-carboxylate synthase-like protein 1 [Physella acuta]XP_059142105.1 1-aminocyclopropane-1-carboxylate synthase-like protein 1 [Physella acuta]
MSDQASEASQDLKPENTAAEKKESLEDLLATLGQQIRNSDWLQQNTPEKFEEENPEIAQVFKNIANDSKAKGDGGQG